MPVLKYVATATITLYTIEEVSIYQSEIISSNGNIFHPYDMTTTLHFRVYSGGIDITDTIKDIRWTKYSFDTNSVLEDKNWGDPYMGSSSISIAKQDINQKCVIQADAYMIKKQKETCVASARITLMDINDLYTSEIPPSNPIEGMLWVNTSTNPPAIFSWNTKLNKWTEVGKTSPFVRNLIKNSNFWKLNTEGFMPDNENSLEKITIETISDKKWAKLKSRIATYENVSAGLTYTSTDTIVKNSYYTFSVLAYAPSFISNYPGNNIYIKISSLDANDSVTTLDTKLLSLSAAQEVQKSVTVKTLNNTEKIRIFIGVEPNKMCEFYITELSLYNTDSYYPWELAPEDIQEQLDDKLNNDHNAVFNALTRNGTMEGIYIDIDENGYEHYYFNASHLKTGSIDGGLINGIGLNIKDDATGESIFHVYKDEEGTHIDMIANNLYIGTQEASTVNYVNTSMTSAVNNAASYTDGQITEVNKVVETKANTKTVDDLEKRVTGLEYITEDDQIVGTVIGSETYTNIMATVNRELSEQSKMIQGLEDDLESLENDIETNIKVNISNKKIVSVVRDSKEYKDDLNNKLNTADFDTYKKDTNDYLTLTFSNMNTEINKKANSEVVSGIDGRLATVESNTKASSIVSTVRQSQDYINDLNGKLNTSVYSEHLTSMTETLNAVVKTNNVINKINNTPESELIRLNKIEASTETNHVESFYFGATFTKNGIEIDAPTIPGIPGLDDLFRPEVKLDDVLDKIEVIAEENNLKLNVTDIQKTNYVKVSDDRANIYMNNNEMIKLLIYEIQKLKAKIAELEGGE
jgi:hypothetical protein